MPITKSAKKALHQSKRKAEINKPLRSRARSLLKKARQKKSSKTIAAAYSALDKATKKHIFSKKKVDRLKSRLAKKSSEKKKSSKD